MNLADNIADTHRDEPTLSRQQIFSNTDQILNLNKCEDAELPEPYLFTAVLMQKGPFPQT